MVSGASPTNGQGAFYVTGCEILSTQGLENGIGKRVFRRKAHS
jgi:hypothetical protein